MIKVKRVPIIDKKIIIGKCLRNEWNFILYPALNIIQGRTKVKKNKELNWNPLKNDEEGDKKYVKIVLILKGDLYE